MTNNQKKHSIHTSLPEAETYINTQTTNSWLFNMSPKSKHPKPCWIFHSASISSIIFFLAHSGQMMFSPSWKDDFLSVSHNRDMNNSLGDPNSWNWMLTWMKPLPTMESLQMLQKKHSLCQASVSNATNLVLPNPPLPRKESTKWIFHKGIACFIS